MTTTKTRYLAGWTHTTEQQVLRVDREPHGQVPPSVQEAIERKARQVAGQADAVIISDYGFGAATPALAKKLKAKLITLDSRYRLLEYAGAGITAATPNEPELEAAYHAQVGTDTAKLEELGGRLVSDLGLQALAVTRGKDGIVVFEPGASEWLEKDNACQLHPDLWLRCSGRCYRRGRHGDRSFHTCAGGRGNLHGSGAPG